MPKTKSNPYCPSCDHQITDTEINITEGVALCSHCGLLSQLSDLSYTNLPVGETLKNTPKQINIIADRERIEIRISLFSMPKFLGSLFATLFWNGITSIFLSLAVAAVFYNTIGHVPDWLPVPGLEEGKPVMNDSVMGVGMTVFICLFLTPFVTIGLGMLINTFIRLFGSTTIIIDQHKSSVSTGISFLRFFNFFNPNKITSIQLNINKLIQNESQQSYLIEMESESQKPVKFGRFLDNKQQDWLIICLKQILIHKRPSKHSHEIPHLYWLK